MRTISRALTLLLLAAMAATAHGATAEGQRPSPGTTQQSTPAEVHTGGTLLDARRVTFQALKTLEARGHHIPRDLMTVRTIPKGHVCRFNTACATANVYTGQRVVWLSRELVAEHGWIKQPGKPRRPTCLLWTIALHELQHHESTLRVTHVYPGTGYLALARYSMTEEEYDVDHARLDWLAHVYAAQARRNGRCVDDVMGLGGYLTHELLPYRDWHEAQGAQIAAGLA